MRSACKSDRGVVRENNEDFVLADETNGIFLLADGMGGGPAGEVASELAVTTAHLLLMRYLPDVAPGFPLPTPPPPGEGAPTKTGGIGRILAEALAAAHSAVAKRALGDPALEGMGTTLEMVVVRGAEAILCHVGDSRVYLFRQGALRQVTTDDNYAALLAQSRMVPAGGIPSRFRHILTQAVGVSDELIPEIRTVELKPGDLLLICSDGVTEALRDQEIEALMGQNRTDLDAVANSLVRAAIDNGGPDNVSVIVVEPIAAISGGSLPELTG
ncbi:MAG: hypothetical protein A2075_04860 [Geobacteraceae bacterium GWC2_58_44]|nr:MAG: hypothetical protein A2075_04860 [Geobacteraceae bacterium GWC2_58_44]